jgi:hypothetical protein
VLRGWRLWCSLSQPWQQVPSSALIQPRVAAAVVATFTVLTAGYGTAGRADFVWYSVLQAWAVGPLLWQTVPISRRSRRSTFLPRLLLWSSLPALVLQQIAYVLGNQRRRSDRRRLGRTADRHRAGSLCLRPTASRPAAAGRSRGSAVW